MLKKVLLICLLVSICFAIDNVTYTTTYVDGETIEAVDFEKDKDSTGSWGGRVQAILNDSVVKYHQLESGDSTLSRLNVDTIGSDPYIESSLTTPKASADSLVATDGLSINGRVLVDVEGSFYGTYLGFSGTVQDTIRYAVVGNVVTLSFDRFAGTSNQAYFQLDSAGVPAVIKPRELRRGVGSGGEDNGTNDYGVEARVYMEDTPFIAFSILTATGVYDQNGWTASGDKGFGLFAPCITYLK